MVDKKSENNVVPLFPKKEKAKSSPKRGKKLTALQQELDYLSTFNFDNLTLKDSMFKGMSENEILVEEIMFLSSELICSMGKHVNEPEKLKATKAKLIQILATLR